MTLSPAFLDELRSRTLLSTLIGRTVKLTKAGREYKGCCPIHNEKSPSFTVNDDKGFYHCFGCSAHGDAIKWLVEQNGMTFIEAVKQLADASGMEVPARSPQEAEKAERITGLRPALEAVQAFYARELEVTGAAMEALAARGIGPDMVARFGLGFAPSRRGHLKGLGPTSRALFDAGVIGRAESDGAAYERFRSRIMIPVHDARGQLCGFGGRDFGGSDPKYLNSPDSEIFDKGRLLFNAHRAAERLAALRRVASHPDAIPPRLIIVEGYMDVIALDQAGFAAVAPMGTALTPAQIERALRMDGEPILMFDGDSAGQKAAMRAADAFMPFAGTRGAGISFVTLPSGMDPDDVLRSEAHGVSAMVDLITRAVPLGAYVLERTLGEGVG